jgi:FkbM family methyltransferase
MFLIKEGSHLTDEDTFLEFKTEQEINENQKMYYFHLDKNGANWVYKNDVTEKPLIFWAIQNYANKNKNFVDIGAHLGIYTWTFAKFSNHVYSFECNPKTFCYLAANVALHNVTDKVTLINSALGNENKNMDYIIRNEEGGENGFFYKNDNDNQLKKLSLQVKTLDSFNIKDIGLIKIDVEGFEKEVIEGALKTLENNNYPPMIFESWNEYRKDSVKNVKELRDDLFKFISSLGYKILELQGGFGEIFLATK